MRIIFYREHEVVFIHMNDQSLNIFIYFLILIYWINKSLRIKINILEENNYKYFDRTYAKYPGLLQNS
jgi:hypothetical protein